MEIKSKYQTYKIKEGFTFTEPTKTIQSAKNGTLIESYLKKYQITGVLGNPARLGLARYGDFADLPSFQESANRVAQTTQFFESLPSSTRKEFGNDVSSFVAFITNPANVDRAKELGLVQFMGAPDVISEKVETQPLQSVAQTAVEPAAKEEA